MTYRGLHLSLALGALFAATTTIQVYANDPVRIPAESASKERIIRIPGTDTVVRIRTTDGRQHAEVSRDAGRTWQPFVDPDGEIALRYRAFDPRIDGEPNVADRLTATAGNRLFIVQYETDVLPEYNAALDALGAQRFHVAPNQGYVVRMDRGLLNAVRQLPFVRWIGEFHPAYKLHESILAELATGDAKRREYNVVMVDDVHDRRALLGAIEQIGGRSQPDSGMGILQVAELDSEQLLHVAGLDSVLWIDPLTAPETDIDQARIQGGANYIETAAGFNGKGVTGMIMEGVYATHTEFAALAPYRAAPLAYAGGSGGTSHGTNTAGEIYARGANPLYRGLIPFAQMLYCNYNVVYNNNNRRLVTTWGLQNDEMIETASWGYARTYFYESRSAEMDDIIFDLGVLTTQSQSNANSQDSRPQAWAKNILAVGGFSHHNTANPADDTSSGASFGPAQDGRMKPDLCAYYDLIGTTSGSGSSYTTGFGGTSGATPIVNGHCGLTVEMFAHGLFGQDPAADWQDLFGHRPKFTTAKSILAATSYLYAETKFGTAAQTRNRQGWGFPDLTTMYDSREKMLVSDEEFAVAQGGGRMWIVYVPAGTPELRVAMNYADPEAASPFTITRQNSVDLVARSPNGTTYRGNNGMTALTNATPSNWTTAGGVANDRDTSEHVFVQNPAAGIWLVSVQATVVRVDGHVETPAADVDFGVAIRGIGGSRNQQGAILDLASTGPGNLTASVSSIPAGAVGGWTFFSLNDSLVAGNGFLFGVEADTLSEASLALPAANGNPFSFAVAGAGYPNAPYAFPTDIANLLTGQDFDAVVVFYDATGQIVGVSNADRVAVQ